MKREKLNAEAAAAKQDRARRILFILAALVALAGLGEATYLTASHFAGTNVICGTAANCSQVLGGPYAKIGPVPVAALGALAYFTAFSLATLAAFGYRRAEGILSVLVAIMFVATLWLLYVQAYVLHTFCDYCLFSAALIFLLAGLLIAIPRRA